MANIKIISTFESAKDYIKAVEERHEDTQAAWRKYMIEPYWADITHNVNRDVSFMQPAPITDILRLKEQIELLSRLSIEDLRAGFVKIAAVLPVGHDEPIFTALYPASDSDKVLKERQNGVVGSGPDGNIIISINPLAQDYYNWIFFVFAHEYHHGVWGYNCWVNGMSMDGGFYEPMIIEGQADFFAESLFPKLIPQWNRPFDGKTETALWERLKTDATVHGASLFGDESLGLPWCMGYSLGRAIVGDYMRKHPHMSTIGLIKTPPVDILNGSRFKI